MASHSPFAITKQPLKFIEVPLRKFSDEAIPFHLKLYDSHKTNIYKLLQLNNADQTNREIKAKKRMVKQLKDLMYELDTLRTQVEDCDLDNFDAKTLSLRRIILTLITGYGELEKLAEKFQNPSGFEENATGGHPLEGAQQIQMQCNMNDLKMQEYQARLNRVEEIHKDVEDLHEMYKNLNELVTEQGEDVDTVADNIESAQLNVEAGAKHVVIASKLKAVTYPATGALIGGLIGGPLGLLAGLKVGGIAAIGCAVAGYTGGKLFKKANDPDNIKREEPCPEVKVEKTEKKDM